MADPERSMDDRLRGPAALALLMGILALAGLVLPLPTTVEDWVGVAALLCLLTSGVWGGIVMTDGFHKHYLTCTRPVQDCRNCYEYEEVLSRRGPLSYDEQRAVRDRAARTMLRIDPEESRG